MCSTLLTLSGAYNEGLYRWESKLELLMKINMCYDNVTIKDEGSIWAKTTMVI